MASSQTPCIFWVLIALTLYWHFWLKIRDWLYIHSWLWLSWHLIGNPTGDHCASDWASHLHFRFSADYSLDGFLLYLLVGIVSQGLLTLGTILPHSSLLQLWSCDAFWFWLLADWSQIIQTDALPVTCVSPPPQEVAPALNFPNGICSLPVSPTVSICYCSVSSLWALSVWIPLASPLFA